MTPNTSFQGTAEKLCFSVPRRLRRQAAPELERSPLAPLGENAGAEPVPLPSATLRENQGHETDRFAAAQPRRYVFKIQTMTIKKEQRGWPTNRKTH